MNKKNEYLLQGIKSKAELYTKKVSDTLEGFNAMMERTKNEGAIRKDEKEYIRENSAKHTAATRAILEKAASAFASEVRDAAQELRNQLLDSLSHPVPAAVIQQLDAMTKFHIKPSKTQVENLIDLNSGNLLGLECIASVLTANGSDYKVIFHDVSDYEADLQTLERVAQTAYGYVPLDHHHAGCMLYDGQQREMTRPDGTRYASGYTWDSVSIIGNKTAFESYLSEIDEMTTRWVADVSSVEMNEVSAKIKEEEAEAARAAGKDIPDEPDPVSTVSIQKTDDDAVRLAKSIGAEKAGDSSMAQVMRDHYVKL